MDDKLGIQIDNYNLLWKNPFLPEPDDHKFGEKINDRLKAIEKKRNEYFSYNNNYKKEYEIAKQECSTNPDKILNFEFKWF